MRSSIAARAAAATALALLGMGTTVGHAEDTICTVGGSPTARTGIFRADPGLKLTPSPVTTALYAEGELAGEDPECYGSIILELTLAEGASCFGFTESGEVRFVDEEGEPVDRGIDHLVGGGTAYSRSLMYGPDGELRATLDAFARSADTIPFTESCNSEEGLTEGTFASVAGLRFLE